MKQVFLASIVLLAGCFDEESSPRGTNSKRTPMYHGEALCIFQNTANQDLNVVNVKVYGGQSRGTVNNLSVGKSLIEKAGSYDKRNTVTSTGNVLPKSLLPPLGTQFQGFGVGSDVLTMGQGKDNLIFDFGKVNTTVFPCRLKPGEQLTVFFNGSKMPDDFEASCDFDWD